MKVALLATLVAFGGSLAGFGLTTRTSDAPSPEVAGSPPTGRTVPTEDVVVRGKDRDCPAAKVEQA